MLPTITLGDGKISIPRQCLQYEPATERLWERYLEGLKREARLNEECRRRAMSGEVLSNQLLPAEYIQKRRRKI